MIHKRMLMISLFTIYFILMGFWGNGCSSGNNSTDPVRTDLQDKSELNSTIESIDEIQIAITDYLPDGGSTGIGALGIFDVSIDPVTMTGDLISLRKTAAIGDSFVVDITNFLTLSPCTDCLRITGIKLSPDGNLIVIFTIRHPFPHGTLDLPPSAKNRLDLHIFDVYGVMHFTGNLVNFPLMQNTVSPVTLVNADGYTGQFDSRIDPIFNTDATIHPYRVMSLDPTEGNFDPSSLCGFDPINAPTGHNILKMGGTSSSAFELDFIGMDNINFVLVLTAAYGQSAIRDTRLEPVYYMPEFNRKEAWKVDVNITENTLLEANTSTYFDLSIDIWDWNHGATVDPSLSAKDTIRALSDVESVEVEALGVALDVKAATGPLSGDGQTSPLHYTAKIYNEMGSSPGMRYGLVKVKDSRLPGGNKGGVGDGVDRDGVTFFQLPEFATYQLFSVEVHRNEPVCIITSNPDPPVVNPEEPISFDGSSSYDFDGAIVSYEWDFDYNGSVFNVDATGAVPPAQAYDNNHNINYRTVTVALRTTDNNLPVPYQTICTLDVTVLRNRKPSAEFETAPDPPTVKKGGFMAFNATASSDPDGDTLTYEWDWDYTPGNFTVDDIGATTLYQFNEVFCGTAALRVSDQGVPNPSTDIETIQINVLPGFGASTEQEIDTTMSTRNASHNLYSTVIATDPNSNDIYVAYYGLTGGSTHRIRVQRSYNGGLTWSAPYIVNDAPTSTGLRGIAIVVVPDQVPGSVYVFWISDGANSGGVTSDGWNIRFNKGIPTAASNSMWWDTSWNQDITLFSLSLNYPNQYNYYYYQYSQPANLAAIADPTNANAVYVAYSETSSDVNCGESVRLVKTSDIQNYPNASWLPLTTTSHVDSATGAVNDFTGIDLSVDTSHNVYVVWDNNISGQVKIRKYPFGYAPGNSAQIIETDADYTHLSNPRIAIGLNNVPVVVYNDTFFPGGIDGVSDIILSHGIDTTPAMSDPICINTITSYGNIKRNPDISIEKECGTIFVAYEDFRNNPAQSEIYWTALNKDYDVIMRDEILNTSDPAHTLGDVDVHIVINQSATDLRLTATWEQATEDTWVSIAN